MPKNDNEASGHYGHELYNYRSAVKIKINLLDEQHTGNYRHCQNK